MNAPSLMRAEVIAIGDELTSGQRLDTNSQWIAERLGDLGIRVVFHTTVGDDLEAHARVMREAIARADLVVSSGGLGPTADDLTRHAIAQAAGVELVLDQAALNHIRGLFGRRGRTMPPSNEVQAMFPRGSRVVPNPHGSAPGIDIDVQRPSGGGARTDTAEGQSSKGQVRIIALPGVPTELKEMWHATVEPQLRAVSGGGVIVHRRIKCFGVGESDLEQMLPDLIRRGREPTVGITVHRATITLRITASGSSPEECQAAMEPTAQTIYQCLGELVFGEEDDELEHALVRVLAAQGKRLAVAEWGPGGLLSRRLGAADPSSAVFVGGVVVRSGEALRRALGVEPKLIEGRDPDGAAMVAAMATACRERFAADYALAIGPFPAEGAASLARVHFAWADAQGSHTASAPFASHWDVAPARAAKQALNHLRLALVRSSNPK
jgi:nicotinamide-nucleotide amidase